MPLQPRLACTGAGLGGGGRAFLWVGSPRGMVELGCGLTATPGPCDPDSGSCPMLRLAPAKHVGPSCPIGVAGTYPRVRACLSPCPMEAPPESQPVLDTAQPAGQPVPPQVWTAPHVDSPCDPQSKCHSSGFGEVLQGALVQPSLCDNGNSLCERDEGGTEQQGQPARRSWRAALCAAGTLLTGPSASPGLLSSTLVLALGSSIAGCVCV